ncbi:MAG: hypothetical protein HKN33_18425 [Pyrinomonadaceae bacterium]|nr:hypothetical protein [Pyrinomonadaceae bacterium]
MKIFLVVFAVLISVIQNPAQCGDRKMTKEKEAPPVVVPADKFENLPDGVKAKDEVKEVVVDDEGQLVSSKIITVEQKLKSLGAGYQDGILVDSKNNQIRFFKPSIRGASEGPEGDKKFYDLERKRLEDLKAKFTVIEIYINPLKVM